ncbi:reductase [Rathayibacter sp. VKM Ac-2856]|uniref:NAD-dependent epimerase/dehydratase family protein n=1 Tax=unclassified Rathayibacter TaxID=2609250 RepID=UPI0015642453|nr:MULTISPECIES: NAD-dependent epimerase/dehydratase family protein [unclassified Rathayibacter]NQX06001.1 reductase [Rathayibacter sp. VKM Ac-2858]NQX21049.1 reductase [Rathayibacter sp. VKM Ac-2856]
MRRVLVLGGSGWLGRRLAERAVAAGDEVTCLARGEAGAVPDGARHVRVDRRDRDAYGGVRGEWDEVVELAHAPGLVGPALDRLASAAAHWTLVSSVSVYVDVTRPGADESAALVEPADPEQYADAKVLAERAAADALGDRLLIARPGLIAGPGDPSDRLGYWPARFARGGTVLAPETTGRTVQAIDVDDLAGRLHAAGTAGATGAVDAVGPVVPLGEFLAEAAALAGFSGHVVHVDDETLLAHDVRYWAGPRSLPLWLPADAIGFSSRSTGSFLRAGGRHRPWQETLHRVLDDERARGIDRSRRSGLDPLAEQDVLAALR